MTVYMNLRQSPVAGGTKSPSFLSGDGTLPQPALTDLSEQSFAIQAGGRDVLFATHGFNVNMAAGICALGRLEATLALPSTALFVGVLWPGDWWIPVINYPFEGETTIDCGTKLADFCNRRLGAAASLSFASHSLGARVILEAIRRLSTKARSACIMAGAVNDDCLAEEYSGSLDNCEMISVLASKHDMTLKCAFPIGDPIADLLHLDHKPFAAALGYAGPPAPIGATRPPWQTPDAPPYDHGDYLPPSAAGAPFPDPAGLWNAPAAFLRRAFARQAQTWPPP